MSRHGHLSRGGKLRTSALPLVGEYPQRGRLEGACSLGGRSFKKSSALRSLLDFHNAKPFDAQASFELYQKLLGPVEDVLGGMKRIRDRVR